MDEASERRQREEGEQQAISGNRVYSFSRVCIESIVRRVVVRRMKSADSVDDEAVVAH